ncbi:MAG: hypothetical protein DRO08_02740 [Thermoprotei archaeon]|nr:MAG: hypothetical protein DRO08_02740 [Thermoprotei archaeon]
MLRRIKKYGVAIIGDENLIIGFRLAGVKKVYEISKGSDEHELVRKYLKEALEDPKIGVIIMHEKYGKHVEDIVSEYKGKNIPIILYVPGIEGPMHPDVKEYYKQYVKKVIGFAVEF